MKQYFLPILAIVAGMILLAAAIAWPRLAPPGEGWSEQQAKAFEQASQEVDRAASSPPTDANRAEREAAAERLELLRQQRDAAIGGGVVLSMILQMLGVGLGLIGAVALIMRQNEAEDRRNRSA